MKIKFSAVMLIAASLMVMACNGKEKKEDDQTKGDTETVETTAQQETDDPSHIVEIRQTWAAEPIKVDAGDKAIGIEQLALAFCKKYPKCITNDALKKYFLSPEDFEIAIYDVDFRPKNGYVRCMMMVETTPLTSACYWNRTDGHKLFAAFMEQTDENMSYDEHLVVFYDYNPATSTMTPEPALTSMIEERMKKYDSFSVDLPAEGKDIVVHGYIIDKENDSAETEDITLKWDGNSFE